MRILDQQLKTLRACGEQLQRQHLRDLFAADGQRFAALSAYQDDLLYDFSREQLDVPALELLLELARGAGVAQRRDAMLAGAGINFTEGRAVLHTALRDGAEVEILKPMVGD